MSVSQAVFGWSLVVVVAGAAAVFGWLQLAALRVLARADALPDDERRFGKRQARRRLAGCGLLAFMAVLLAAQMAFWEGPAQALADDRDKFARGEAPAFTEQQKTFLRIWGGSWVLLTLALTAVVFLAAIDRYATRTHALRQLRRLQADRRAMVQRQADRLRAERGG